MATQTRIISGFPGVGKTTCVSKFNDPYNGCFVMDSDSSKFPKDNFPQNYLEHIYFVFHVSKPTILLVSSHEAVRNGLVELGLKFDLVYPDKCLLGEYIQRFTDRGNSCEFIDLVYKNWEEWILGCENQEGCQKIILPEKKYLSDYINNNPDFNKK